MPWKIIENHSECEERFAVVKEDDGEVVGCHASEDAAKEQVAALYASEADMELPVGDFYFVELQEANNKPFPGFAVGKFRDMYGRTIEFAEKQLPAYLQNTLNTIAAHKAKGMPGLPIDARDHDKGDAAGWIVDASSGKVLDSDGNLVSVINFVAEWTKLGKELIGEKIRVNFSPTVFDKVEIIRGGTLTNYPASVDKNGIPLFSAIELSEGIHVLVEPETAVIIPTAETEAGGDNNNGDEIMTKDLTELSEEDRGQLLEEAKKAVLADLSPADGATADDAIERLREELNLSAFADVADLSKAREAMLSQMKSALEAEYSRMQANAGKMLAEMMSQIKRDQRVAELSQRWTNGTDQHPHGFPVGTEEMEAFLGSLDEGQRKGAESIFGRIFEQGLTDYAELGTRGDKAKNRQPVPEYAVDALKAALANGAHPQEFFELAGLGSADQYDLTPFKEDK